MIAIDQSTQNFILSSAKKYSPDVIAQSLADMGKVKTVKEAQQLVVDAIAAQAAVEPAQPEQSTGIIDLDLDPTVEPQPETMPVASESVSDEELAEFLRKRPRYANGGHARDAEREERICQMAISTNVPHPPELSSLIAEGKVWYEPKYEHWVIKRCQKCGEFGRDVCCGEPTRTVSVAWHDNIINDYGKQAAGLIPIRRPEPPKPAEQIWKESDWWREFRGVGELQGDGNIEWVIQNVVPAGVTVLTAMPKDGKSFVALSFIKAITTGQPWLGRIGFEVPETMPVLWLAAESGDSGLKIRCKKFGITEDKSRFICRTLTQGMVNLDDPKLEKLVKEMKPYIVLETLVRFGDGEDEDDAKEASRLAKMIFRLIAWGARGVLAIHHSRKDLKRGGVDMEKAVRGSGDYAALADAIWVLVRDERLYQEGKGVNEISLSGWGRDFNPYPMRLALTRRAPADLPKNIITFAPGLVSVIDSTNDLGWVDQSANAVREAAEQAKDISARVDQLIQDDPAITVKELVKRSGLSTRTVDQVLKELGWTKPTGRAKKGEVNRWEKLKSNAAD